MGTPITLELLLEIIAAIVAIVGGVKAGEYIIGKILARHDKETKWNSNDDSIAKCNERIDDIEKTIKEMNVETDKKLQEIKSEQCMLTYCMMATLDGLHQLGCNGKVTAAREELDKYYDIFVAMKTLYEKLSDLK